MARCIILMISFNIAAPIALAAEPVRSESWPSFFEELYAVRNRGRFLRDQKQGSELAPLLYDAAELDAAEGRYNEMIRRIPFVVRDNMDSLMDILAQYPNMINTIFHGIFTSPEISIPEFRDELAGLIYTCFNDRPGIADSLASPMGRRWHNFEFAKINMDDWLRYIGSAPTSNLSPYDASYRRSLFFSHNIAAPANNIVGAFRITLDRWSQRVAEMDDPDSHVSPGGDRVLSVNGSVMAGILHGIRRQASAPDAREEIRRLAVHLGETMPDDFERKIYPMALRFILEDGVDQEELEAAVGHLPVENVHRVAITGFLKLRDNP